MWAIFSILAAICWAIVNIVDKYILTKWVRRPIIPVIILGVVGLIASVIVYFIYGFSYLSYFNILLALVAGIFYILMSIFYLKAVKVDDIICIYPCHKSTFNKASFKFRRLLDNSAIFCFIICCNFKYVLSSYFKRRNWKICNIFKTHRNCFNVCWRNFNNLIDKITRVEPVHF